MSRCRSHIHLASAKASNLRLLLLRMNDLCLQIEDAVAAREAEEMGNAMKALENRTIDSKREMDIMSALDEMKALNAQHSKVDTEAALAALKRSAEEEVEACHCADHRCPLSQQPPGPRHFSRLAFPSSRCWPRNFHPPRPRHR